MAREESELLYFSNKFKNGISNARKNTKAIFSNKADQIKAEHNAEEQKAINLETQGNGKYTEDGILGRVFGINTIPAETELNKYDMISYNYGYYDASNVRIIPILCEGKIPERLNRAIARAIDKKTIDKSLVGELYPEELLSDIGRRDAEDGNINIEHLPQIVQTNRDYLRGYNSHKTR